MVIHLGFLIQRGLRQTDDPIEMEGIRRALKLAEQADLILFLQDPDIEFSHFYSKLPSDKLVTIFTKKDINYKYIKFKGFYFYTSVADISINWVLEYCASYFNFYYDNKDRFCLSRERYIASLNQIATYLSNAKQALNNDDFFIFSEELRCSLSAVEELTCKLKTEDMLGDIFSTFCIGK